MENKVTYITILLGYCASLFAVIKTYFLKSLTLILAFFSPVAFVFLIVGMSIGLDTLFGRWAAKHHAIKQNIPVREYVTSKLTREGMLDKAWMYLGIIAFLFVFDAYVINKFVVYYLKNFPVEFAITKIVGLGLVAVEFDSIDEKYYNVKGIRLKDELKNKASFLKYIINEAREIIGKTKKEK